MGIELATAYVTILPETSKIAPAIKKELGTVDKSGGPAEKTGKTLGSRISSGIGKTLKRGALAAGGAVAGVLGTSLIKGFGRLNAIEQAEAKLKGLGHSGESVTGIMQNALASVKGTAFGLDEAASIAAGTVAAGIKPGKDLERTLKLVGDAATIAGTDMGAMGAIFNKIAAGNRLSMEEVNQLSDRGIPILQMIAEEYGVTAIEARKMVSEGKVDFATFQKMMEGSLGGAALESGKTVQGAFKNMGAALGRVGANLLSGVFPHLQGGFVGITGALDNLGPIAEKVGDKVGQALGWIADKVRAFVTDFQNGEGAAGRLRGVIEGLFGFVKDTAIPAAEDLVGWLKDNESTIKLIASAVAGATIAYKTYTLVMAGVAAAKKIVTAAQKAWNAAMKANPIGIIITAIGLLVGALVYLYNNNETVKNAIDKAWKFIKVGIDAVVSWFKNTAWPWMRDALGWIGDKVSWLWKSIIEPYFTFILGIWKSVFSWIKDTGWPWLRDAMTNIGSKVSSVWTDKIKPAFDKIKGGVEAVVDGFRKAKDGISTAWSTVTGAITGPLTSALTFINNKFIDPLNGLLKKIGVSFRVPRINVPTGGGATGTSTKGGPTRAFSSGGVIPGYSPGVDDHLFYSPTGGYLALSGGESVMRPEWTRALGKGTVDAWNAAARRGGVAGVRKAMGFASGGIIPWIKKRGTDAIDLVSSVGKVLSDPKGALRDFASKALAKVSDNPLVKALASVAGKIAEGVAQKVTDFGGGDVSGRPGGAMHWKAIWSLIKAVAPEARMTSNYRPGAITASGFPSRHGLGRAVDLVSPNMLATFKKIRPLRAWSELYYSPAEGLQLLNGRRHIPQGVTRRMHYDHIHAAMAQGGVVKPFKPFVADSGVTLAPGINVVHNKLGKPEPLARTDQMPPTQVIVNLDVSDLAALRTVEEFLQLVDTRARMSAGVRPATPRR